jgi:hypothetical protein
MSDPITAMTIGAAISGGTSLAKGKSLGSSLQNAAIGAALGGGGSYLGGLFGGAGAAGGTTSGATGGTGLLSGFQGAATTPVSMGTGGFASGIGGQAIPNVATNLGTNVATTASSVADDIVAQGTPNIGNVNISNLDDINPALITDPSKLSSVTPPPSQTFTDGVLDPIRPMFENPIQVTEKAAKAGGYEKPLYERAYESVFNYAQKNPLEVAGVGLVASGKFGRQTPAPEPRIGTVNKGTPPQTGQMLQVRRPTRFSQG